MIGFKNLQAFVTLVEENSFTRAADKLYQTQPALSIQIKKLESILEARLIERKDKEILLTDAGKIFYPEAKRMLEHYMRTKKDIVELKDLSRGELLIGASTLPGEYILPQIVCKFQQEHPRVKVGLNIADTGKVVEAIKDREVHIGFLGALPNDPKLCCDVFREDELYLIVSPEYEKEICWSNFPMDDLILRERGSGTRQVVEEYLKDRLNLKMLTPKMEVGSTRAIMNMVAAGLGISYVSRWAVEEALLLGKVKAYCCPENNIKRSLYKAVLKDSYLSYSARAFWELTMRNTI
jgi:DNA-binding transcriptional LysR family regulator